MHLILNRPFKHNYFYCVVIVLLSLFKVEPYQWFSKKIVRTEWQTCRGLAKSEQPMTTCDRKLRKQEPNLAEWLSCCHHLWNFPAEEPITLALPCLLCFGSSSERPDWCSGESCDLLSNCGEAMAVPAPLVLTREVMKIRRAGLNASGWRVNAQLCWQSSKWSCRTTCYFLATLPVLILLQLHLFTISTNVDRKEGFNQIKTT